MFGSIVHERNWIMSIPTPIEQFQSVLTLHVSANKNVRNWLHKPISSEPTFVSNISSSRVLIETNYASNISRHARVLCSNAVGANPTKDPSSRTSNGREDLLGKFIALCYMSNSSNRITLPISRQKEYEGSVGLSIYTRHLIKPNFVDCLCCCWSMTSRRWKQQCYRTSADVTGVHATCSCKEVTVSWARNRLTNMKS